MQDISALLQQGTTNAWLFIPSAILLGALHGLEPGHSKTMMAAFIIAVHGTVKQAILLGLAATASHTAVVWLVALIGMRLGSHFNAETSEPYFQVASAILIICIALWMLVRTAREQQRETSHEHDHGGHGHDHSHSHDHSHDETRRIVLGHGLIAELSIMEDGMEPRFWIALEHEGRAIAPSNSIDIAIETTRRDQKRQLFRFLNKGMYLESIDEIPEPHEFTAQLTMTHDGHSHVYDVEFTEHDYGVHHSHDHGHNHGHDHHDHDHDHTHEGLQIGDPGYQDAHERAHANDIKRRFGGRNVTTGQIVLFGLTGGLIPCPAAITVLLLCLQLKKFTLGVALVLCFSIGLAITMVTAGTIAALSVRHASRRFSGFGKIARRAPYFSSALIIAIGLYVGFQGMRALFAG